MQVTEGSWWPADYNGEPLVSFDTEIAKGLRVKVGDTVTVNVLGRNVTARVANLREVKWESLSLNFVMVFSPNTLAGAPHNLLTTIALPKNVELAAEARLARDIGKAFPSTTAIRVKDALEAVSRILAAVGDAVRITASVTLLAGILVLGGAIVAGHHRRVYDAVVLKVLGATRADIARAYLIEYGLLGIVTGLLAAALGTLAGYLFQTQVLEGAWVFLPLTVLATALIGTLITLALGLAEIGRAHV